MSPIFSGGRPARNHHAANAHFDFIEKPTLFRQVNPSSKDSGICPSKEILQKKNRAGRPSNLHEGFVRELRKQRHGSCWKLCIHFAQGKLWRRRDSIFLWHTSCFSSRQSAHVTAAVLEKTVQRRRR